MNKNKILFVGIFIGLIGLILCYTLYSKIYGSNVKKEGFVYIKNGSNFNDIKNQLSLLLNNVEDFFWVAEKKSFSKPRGGKFKVSKRMSNNDLVNLLRSGKQTPVIVSFNNQDYIEKLASKVSNQIEADSISIVKAFFDTTFLQENNLTKESVLGICIPNSYELYWNSSAISFRDRILREYKSFWNSNRTQKAKEINLTPNEVITLASIVQKETSKIEERPIVAGLYLNRLKRKIPLQADPTIVYLLKKEKGKDFTVKRVLKKDLEIKSPYNTYLNRGLPPSLIAMPDISSIDAVLNYQKHHYIYMCASLEKVGYHEFATTLKEHNRNAYKYQNWLNKQGINR